MSGVYDRAVTVELITLAEEIKCVKDFQKAIRQFYVDKKVNWGQIKVITEFTLMLLDRFPPFAKLTKLYSKNLRMAMRKLDKI